MDKQIAAYLNFIECKQDLENTFLTEEEFKSVVVLVNNPNLLEIEEVCVKKKQQNMLSERSTIWAKPPKKDTSGDWGYRSPYLSQITQPYVKRMLCQLS